MAPALRMTRSIKEKLNSFFCHSWRRHPATILFSRAPAFDSLAFLSLLTSTSEHMAWEEQNMVKFVREVHHFRCLAYLGNPAILGKQFCKCWTQAEFDFLRMYMLHRSRFSTSFPHDDLSQSCLVFLL